MAINGIVRKVERNNNKLCAIFTTIYKDIIAVKVGIKEIRDELVKF